MEGLTRIQKGDIADPLRKIKIDYQKPTEQSKIDKNIERDPLGAPPAEKKRIRDLETPGDRDGVLQRQIFCISTKRRRYFKMRKHMKKKAKKAIRTLHTIPWVDRQAGKPPRTWKTPLESKYFIKKLRAGPVKKGFWKIKHKINMQRWKYSKT
eukprot:GDKI01032225.1.p2 GENE.GDKI01032225.1~~GDKI01032225.1.p2  ORF type:complete len:153 (+),score=24.14 GDKI01032225.1:63-521(+)